jgi:hypothetical protein
LWGIGNVRFKEFYVGNGYKWRRAWYAYISMFFMYEL